MRHPAASVAYVLMLPLSIVAADEVREMPRTPQELARLRIVHQVAGFKNTGVFVSYGELLAASGLKAVTFGHRLTAPGALPDAAADVQDLVAHVRAQADALGIDADRLAVWVFSGGGPLLSPFLKDAPPYVRAIVSYYAIQDLEGLPPEALPGLDADTRRRFSPLAQLAASTSTPPILVARAGRDDAVFNDTIDRFVQEALRRNVALEVMNHPSGRHAFDILDDDPRSREVIGRTIEFLKTRLLLD